MNTYGYLYEHQFNPYAPIDTSLARSDDSCDNDQFEILVYLKFNITYTLVVTTHDIDEQGPFAVFVEGPDEIEIKTTKVFPTRTVQSLYSSGWTLMHSQCYLENTLDSDYYYEPMQINVIQSGDYALSSVDSTDRVVGYLYKEHFNEFMPEERLILRPSDTCPTDEFKIISELQSSVTYILIMTAEPTSSRLESNFSILVSGPNNITFNPISMFHIESIFFIIQPKFSLDLRATYTSELTEETQVYPRICGKGNYHYETIEIHIKSSGSYTFDTNSSILLYGYLYKNNFDPSYPNENLLIESEFSCDTYHFELGDYLEANRVYILVVTTFHPNVRGSFTLLVTGPHNLTLNRTVKKHSSCVVGDQCSLFTKGIGMTINDILRNKIQSNIPFAEQSALIKTAAGITMIMFVIGLINGIFSLITFHDKELRKVSCGLYLLASSITSLLTITMFTMKFWFVVLIQLHSTVRSSILRTDCAFIGPVLKLCLYLDGWLNACVAIERTVNVSKGVNFDKKKSQRAARWILLILPIFIMGTLIHEPIHHELFEHTTQKYIPINMNNNSTMNMTMENEHNVLCVIRYSRSVQTYNTITLFIHLVVPFLANLFSALFIIFGTARRRSIAQTNKKSFKQHVISQIREHKQLLISPFILLLLALPRLIMSLASGCVNPSENPWLYLSGYFISFTPPMLVFIVFVLPSEFYRKTFKDSMTQCRQQTHL